jgi:hypothetical protein
MDVKATRCPTCSLWILIGVDPQTGRSVSVTAHGLTADAYARSLVAGVKVLAFANGKLYRPARSNPHALDVLRAVHPCPLPTDDDEMPSSAPVDLCLAASDPSRASQCQRTSAERSAGVVSCSTCDVPPFVADERIDRAPYDGYARSLLVRELGAVVLEVHMRSGKEIYRAK